MLKSLSLGGVSICLPAAGTHYFWLFALLILKMVMMVSTFCLTTSVRLLLPHAASLKMLQRGLSERKELET